jgi:hypothetical protein
MSPRFNHVALSVPGSQLDDAGRSEIVGFYDAVFGWKEMPTMTVPGERLVLQAYSYDQFVFLVADDEPMQASRTDHFGMAVDTQEEFDALLARARVHAEADDRVTLVHDDAETFGDFLTLHSFYVGHLLPMMVEVQYYDWAEGLAPRDGGDG